MKSTMYSEAQRSVQWDFCIEQEVTQALLASGHFEAMTPRMDEDEHSIEMHLPFIKKVRKLGKLRITWPRKSDETRPSTQHSTPTLFSRMSLARGVGSDGMYVKVAHCIGVSLYRSTGKYGTQR